MRKIFYIDGGAGRIVTSIPALEKYIKNNPTEDIRILIGGWDTLLWGNPLLQNITYSSDTKGIFDELVKGADCFVCPEPYQIPDYYNQKISLIEAFDQIINNTKDRSDIAIPNLYLSKSEEKTAANMIADIRNEQKQKITVVIQPFGRLARVDRGVIIDDSSRSLDPKTYMKIVKHLSGKYNLVLFAENQFHLADDTFTFKPALDLRMWMALVASCDYFIGCDSVGQHMARAFNKPGTVLIGSTYPINVTYPDWFNIIEKPNNVKKYAPIRICGLDNHLADRYNDKCMDFTNEEIDDILANIVNDIEQKVGK